MLFTGLLALKTARDLRPLPDNLELLLTHVRRLEILDRNGNPLTVTYQNRWNSYTVARLFEIPDLLRKAFIRAEDKRFFQHAGVDWKARWHALYQNLSAFRVVRGASTITEQVIRMIHPRPRTIWSRWLEGIEAVRLERKISKADILEFYLNQVPYTANRRGVVQAADFYFDRDLDTLNEKEMLTLAVLIRAPSRLDLYGDPERVESHVDYLAGTLKQDGILTAAQHARAIKQGYSLAIKKKRAFRQAFL